jgi:meso-butanediol dehydrogenase/(S,S)-butanediol dehydrogenase/diacetyl reductase
MLQGKSALVTGAARGIGFGIAESLVEAGANVTIADIDERAAQEAADQLKAAGWNAIGIKADVTNPTDVARMIAAVEGAFGTVDVAVNNAGVLGLGTIEELTVEEWNRVLNMNTLSLFVCCKEEVAAMRRRKFGRIINIASIAGKVGFPGMSHYAASKFAAIGFTNSLAKEVAREGITVNAICPGIVGTGMWRGKGGVAERWRKPDETEEQSWERHQDTLLPQGEAQTPEDIGQMVVYLAGASHVTGQALAVDGGFSL